MSDAHQSRWDALTEIARRCVAEKQFDKAEEAFLAALREAEQFGDVDSRVAATLNALARVYHRRSKFFPAAALLHRLLGIKEREHGEQHPELAGILSNLAEMYARLGDTRQELELRSRALDIRTASGESEGGALEGLRARIAELREKLIDEKSRADAARTSPRQRMRLPTGSNDLPLILPTPVATEAQRTPFAPALSPLREAPPWSAPGAGAERAAPRAQRWVTRTPTPAPVPASKPAEATPAAAHAPVLEPNAATVTPSFVQAPLIEPLGASVTPAAPIAAAPRPLPAGPAWHPLAPPAPTTSWPGARIESEREPQPEPDEYIQEAAFRPRRNWRPIATGAMAVALAGVVAVLVMSRPETTASSTGQVEAQSALPAPPPQPSIGPIDRTVKEAMEIGLANLEGASGNNQFSPEQTDEPPVTPGAEPPIVGGTEPGSLTRSAAPSTRPLRVAVPSVQLARVSDSIESAMQAKVDSVTQVSDQTVTEYQGKKPRQ
jgi:tetratricopeptide (TPR) repeat protein